MRTAILSVNLFFSGLRGDGYITQRYCDSDKGRLFCCSDQPIEVTLIESGPDGQYWSAKVVYLKNGHPVTFPQCRVNWTSKIFKSDYRVGLELGDGK